MSDRYTSFVNSPMGQTIAKNLGLPQPVSLDRYTLGDALVSGTVLVGQAAGGSAVSALFARRLIDTFELVQQGAPVPSEPEGSRVVEPDAGAVERPPNCERR